MTEQPNTGFLAPPEPPSPVAQALHDADRRTYGYVMNLTRVWSHQPEAKSALFDLIGRVAEAADLSTRQRAVLVTTAASTLGDGYCSLAWGSRLADETDAATASAVVRGDDSGLDEADRALATWARKVAADPNATEAADVEALRDVGFDDAQILALTTFVALRIAFATVNDALGIAPDAAYADAPVRAAVTFGRPIVDA